MSSANASRPATAPRFGAGTADDGALVTGRRYLATPYLARLTAANGWQADVIRDGDGRAVVLVAVRIGPSWTGSVAIEGEDRTVAIGHRTRDDRLVPPTGCPDSCGAGWHRDGRCADVLAELFELPEGCRQ